MTPPPSRCPQDWPGQNFSALDSVEILHLRSNQGHQRAIALGPVPPSRVHRRRSRGGDGRRRRGSGRGPARIAPGVHGRRRWRGGIRRANPAHGEPGLPAVLPGVPADPSCDDRRGGAGRKFQRGSAPGDGAADGGPGSVEPLCGLGLSGPFAAQVGPTAQRPAPGRRIQDELREPADSRPECDVGIQRPGERAAPDGGCRLRGGRRWG